jgi:exosortase A-associated hydrolase 2
MIETPFFFPNGGYSLFGILHEPAEPSTRPAFVFCHPLAEEKLWAHRVYVSFARRLAAAGFPVLRFDYMGNGDSDGDFSQSSLTTIKSDVRCAVDWVRDRTRVNAVSLLGLRFGGTIAGLMAEELRDVRHLVMWAPIIDGARYMQDVLRVNLTTQMATYKEIRQDRVELVAAMEQGQTVNVDGYELSLPMYTEVSAINFAAVPKTFDGPCLITQIDAKPGRPAPDLQQLAARYARAHSAYAQEEPFWKEIPRWYSQAPNLFAVTTDWLNAQ